MFAIVEIKGKQYKIQKGQSLLIGHLRDAKKKSETSKILLGWNDKTVKVGKPYIDKAKAKFEIIEEEIKAPKITILKHKAKKRYRRKIGFRPVYSKIKITDLKI